MITIYQEKRWEDLNIHQKINEKMVSHYGTFTKRGMKANLASLRQNSGVEITINAQFSDDINFIIDALEFEQEIQYYERNPNDPKKWNHCELSNSPQDYYKMAYMPSSNLWVYAPIMFDAISEIARRLAESLWFPKLEGYQYA